MPDQGRVSRSGSYTATDMNPPTCAFREARSTMDRNRHMATRTSTPTNQVDEALRCVAAAEIGPRAAGTVYYDGPRLVQVRRIITDLAEARRVLRRDSARFAVLIVDLHAGTEHYTGAVWTGSDRVLKAVAA